MKLLLLPLFLLLHPLIHILHLYTYILFHTTFTSSSLLPSFLTLSPSLNLKLFPSSSSSSSLLVGELMIGQQVGWGRLLEITWFTFPALWDAILEESLELVNLAEVEEEEKEEKRKKRRKRGGIYTWGSLTRMHNAGCAGRNAVRVRDQWVRARVVDLPEPAWKLVWFLEEPSELRSSSSSSSGGQRLHAPPGAQPVRKLGVFYTEFGARRVPEGQSHIYTLLRLAARCTPGQGASEAGRRSTESRSPHGAQRSFLWFYFPAGLVCVSLGDLVLLLSLDVAVLPLTGTLEVVGLRGELVSSWRDFLLLQPRLGALTAGLHWRNKSIKPVLCGGECMWLTHG